MQDEFFSTLAEEWRKRSHRALVSQVSPANAALRSRLKEMLDRPAGEQGGFVAEPIVESLFEWDRHDRELKDLDYLRPELVAALDTPPIEYEHVRFAANWRPYKHQHQAWTALESRTPKSVIVSTGTASGKTECFLVPILNDLVRESTSSGRLTGVRALFLYPLNALINSQRERLYGWTHHFKDRVRFCLYNGGTPDRVNAALQASHPNEIKSRKALRADPPPLLVTNATMLEYMLVRSVDAGIVQASRGHLRWIVLDEAHTYVGSAAAEISLLLRRVMHAFGADPKSIRFVATSATMGSAEAPEELRRYLADLAGIAPDQVVVVTGSRVPPTLEPAQVSRSSPLPELEELEALSAEGRFDKLAGCAAVRTLRDELRTGPMPVSRVWARLTGKPEVEISAEAGRTALRYLDLCSTAQAKSTYLLPLRGHFFHRVQPGAWVCSNRACPGRDGTALEDLGWPFGALFLERRDHCDRCGCRVFEMVSCSDCGAEHLVAKRVDEGGKELLTACRWQGGMLDADAEEGEEEEGEAAERTDPTIELVYGGDPTERVSSACAFDPKTGEYGMGEASLRLVLRDADGLWRCARCGGRHSPKREILRPLRLGTNFFLSAAIPALLERLPEHEDHPELSPMRGRRMITFSDSRQGTARFAAKMQLESERNFVRSFVYHKLWSLAAQDVGGEVARLDSEIEALTPLAESNPVLRGVVAEKERTKEELLVRNSAPRISWADLVSALAAEPTVRTWIRENQKARYLPADLPAESWAELCLYREFLRRAKRQNSLETLGLASVTYPALDAVVAAPSSWTKRGLDVVQWREFLALCLDHSVRAQGATNVPHQYMRWMGMRFTTRRITPPETPFKRRVSYPWPCPSGNRPLPRVAQLLCEALQLREKEPGDRAVITELLTQAWGALRHARVFEEDSEGFLLMFPKQIEIAAVRAAHVCPVTRRALDRTLLGITPYVDPRLAASKVRCVELRMPRLRNPFRRRPESGVQDQQAARDWCERDVEVAEARRLGVWTEFSDRIAEFAEYISVGEHSAQQERRRLQELESQFKRGRMNILSCSTTMEMGVDIGGLVAVGMNNAPPGPANFLQRSGRAGRRGQSRAVTLTVCQASPHGEAVFANPMWPFTTPVHVPRVSLESERIVRRHLNALFLSRFLTMQGGSYLSLKCSGFFRAEQGAGMALAERLAEWLESTASSDEEVAPGAERLLARTPLQSAALPELAEDSAEAMRAIHKRWLEEDAVIAADLDAVGGEPQKGQTPTPEQSAVLFQRKRMWGEYLLASLCSEGFLPSHGFPLHVIPFIPTTYELLLAEEKAEKNRAEDDPSPGESAPGFRREYPSRHLAVAVREYAPDSVVVLDGLVHESKGLLLSWQLPPGDDERHEVQALRHAWRCKECGASATGRKALEHCGRCGSDQLSVQRFIEPSGFAVDIRSTPDTDVTRQTVLPFREPWISVGSATWASLADMRVGRCRYDPDGVVFHRSAGLHGLGYAVCLECGRAASMVEEGVAPSEMEDHDRLRRGSKKSGSSKCSARIGGFKIQLGLRLGGEQHTDVFEMQLADPTTGTWLNDADVASSVAVAMRQAVAEQLGIDVREVGWATSAGASEGGAARRSILLYDSASGGAGYVAQAARDVPGLLRRARTVLECPRRCDAACHACLLAFDTQDAAERLDRHAALKFLTPALLEALELPEELRVLGGESRLETSGVSQALLRSAREGGVTVVRMFLGGAAAEWDAESWPLWLDLFDLSRRGVRVELALPQRVLSALDWRESQAFAARCQAGGLSVMVCDDPLPATGGLAVVAEVSFADEVVRWATTAPDELVLSEAWCRSDHARRVTGRAKGGPTALRARSPAVDELPRPAPGQFKRIAITRQLDGSITGLGERFWRMIEGASPALRERLDGTVPLRSVMYSDRYVRSPLVARLVRCVVDGLRGRRGGVGSRTRLTIHTTSSPDDRRRPWSLGDDWVSRSDHEAVLVALFSDVPGANVLVKGMSDATAHHRELRLEWEDGSACEIQLDHGLGFLKLRRKVQHRFDEAPDVQAKRIRVADGVVGHDGAHPVFLFSSGVSAAPK